MFTKSTRYNTEFTVEQRMLLDGMDQVIWDAAATTGETMFHAVMMRRYNLVDAEYAPTDEQLMGLFQGLNLAARSSWGGSSTAGHQEQLALQQEECARERAERAAAAAEIGSSAGASTSTGQP